MRCSIPGHKTIEYSNRACLPDVVIISVGTAGVPRRLRRSFCDTLVTIELHWTDRA
jgi:hypothetical protein